ncbi:Coiled-coil protein [Giardia muris]|uniref:Coiled-coil protein n=1 Tax=Giardia muris TaxID=5742 RepID=A0A4Z1T2I1_GIAMU|nr:Coiled-coil protein [Giardia muris]|eukprot:TNJ27247.1 Coiled-coil protein [Giardia muris]
MPSVVDGRALAETQRQLERTTARCHSAQDKLAEAVMEAEHLRRQHDADTRRISAQRQQLEKLSKERTELRKENEQLRQYSTKIEARLCISAQKSGLEAAIEKQQRLEAVLVERNRRITELEELAEAQRRELDIANNAILSREEDLGISASKGGGSKRAGILRTMAILKHEVDALRIQLNEEERKNTNLSTELLTLKQELRKKETQCSEACLRYEELQVDYETLLAQTTKADDDHAKLLTTEAVVRRQARELRRIAGVLGERTVEQVCTELEESRATIDRLRQQVRTLEQNNVSLRRQYSTTEEKLKTLESEHTGQLIAIDELAACRERLRIAEERVQQYEGYVTDSEHLAARLSEYEAEIETLTTQKAHLQRALINAARNKHGFTRPEGSE